MTTPAQPNLPLYDISELYLVPDYPTIQAATAAAVTPEVVFNPDLAAKGWVLPVTVDLDNPMTSITVVKIGSDGHWAVKTIQVDSAFMGEYNIPLNDHDMVVAKPALPVPIRPLLANESLVEVTEVPGFPPVPKIKRTDLAQPLSQADMITAIYNTIVRGQ